MARGKLTQNRVHLKKHEYNTVKLLLATGSDVELIPPSHGIAWEMKSPEGSGRYTIKNAIQHASHQSQNIIIDLRRYRSIEEKAVKELVNYFNLSRRLKRMKIICKDDKILDYTK